MEAHPATLWESYSDAIGDRPALVQGSRRTSWHQFDDRAARLAGALADAGIGPGAKVGSLLYNGPEYLETHYAVLKLRAVPFNVNYRYTADEVAYLLDNADAEALVFHASLAEIVAGAVTRSGKPALLIEVDDVERVDPSPVAGSVRYEDVIATATPAPRIERSPADRVMAYTGGTTGMPKGVISTVEPLLGLLQTIPPLMGKPGVALEGAVGFVTELGETGDWLVSLPAPPLMHSTGMGVGAMPALITGGTVVLLEGRHFDAAELWDTVERERVSALTVVGDPFARPMLAELRADGDRDLSSVRSIASSGAMFSNEVKAGLLEHLPQAMILDLIAATEGTMGMSIATAAHPADTARFRPYEGVIVVTEQGRAVEAGSGEAGMIAVPGGAEGYYKDEVKTAATFREIDGTRYTIPGDWATVDADGSLVLLGRGSQCINTAGEKVYPEEVEEALKVHPAIEDALVFGVDDERYGQKVAAVVSWAPGADGTLDDVLLALRTSLASYKVPKDVVIVRRVPRTQVGKADYPTARDLFADGSSGHGQEPS